MIVACPGCDSRYDVSGYAVGQQLRCRCGTVFRRAAVSEQARRLACPHCGAGVEPAASRCDHCASALLVKACPRCLQRVFHGHKHCPECGAELERAAEAMDQPELPCPRCDTALRGRLVGDIVIDECGHCQGLFLDQIAIQRVITDRAQARAEALLGELPRVDSRIGPRIAPRAGEKMYVKCPRCRTLMARRQFATGAGVIVDVCRQHGTFFDVGELPAIIDYVMRGGLEKAAKKDLERERAALAREKERLQVLHRESVRLEVHDNSSRGGAVIELLMSLLG